MTLSCKSVRVWAAKRPGLDGQFPFINQWDSRKASKSSKSEQKKYIYLYYVYIIFRALVSEKPGRPGRFGNISFKIKGLRPVLTRTRLGRDLDAVCCGVGGLS